MSKNVTAIFHVKYTCSNFTNSFESKSRLEYFYTEKTKEDFLHWVMDYTKEFEKQYKNVVIDSVNMI